MCSVPPRILRRSALLLVLAGLLGLLPAPPLAQSQPPAHPLAA